MIKTKSEIESAKKKEHEVEDFNRLSEFNVDQLMEENEIDLHVEKQAK